MNKWTQIGRTELAGEVYCKMSDPRRHYHDLRHVVSMYEYLHDTGVPYDANLDWAVLFHDIVYDEKPFKELRSALAFHDMHTKYRGFTGTRADTFKVGLLIDMTKNHKVYTHSTGPQKALIRADLHELTDPVKATRNFVDIMNESMSLYGISQKEFAENNVIFLAGLRERMVENKYKDEENAEFYEQVIDGIDLTVRLARAVIG